MKYMSHLTSIRVHFSVHIHTHTNTHLFNVKYIWNGVYTCVFNNMMMCDRI